MNRKFKSGLFFACSFENSSGLRLHFYHNRNKPVSSQLIMDIQQADNPRSEVNCIVLTISDKAGKRQVLFN